MIQLLNPPQAGAQVIDDLELNAVKQVLQSGILFRYGQTGSSFSDRAEARLAKWFKRPVHLVSSGTAGLRAALSGLGVHSGDIVLVSAFTFIATASAIASLGAIPVPLEMGEHLEIDLADLSKKLPDAKAVIGVYAPGHPSNMSEARQLANERGVPFIEDACQALGVSSFGKKAGTIGDFGVFSFQQGKQLCTGEGGAILARSRSQLDEAKRFTDHGADREADNRPSWRNSVGKFGDNLRMSELQAAVLDVQASKLSGMLERQRKLRASIMELSGATGVVAPSLDPSGHSGNHLLLIAPSINAAEQIRDIALSKRVWMNWVWQTCYFDTDLFKARGGENAHSVPYARNIAGRLLTITIPPLEDVRASEFKSACASMFKASRELWR